MSGARVEQRLEASGGGRHGGGRGRLFALLGLLLLALVGLGSAVPLWDVDGPPSLVSLEDYSSDLVVLGFALLVLTPWIIRALRKRRVRANEIPDPDLPPVRAPWWMRVLVVAIVIGTVLAAAFVISLLPFDQPRQSSNGGTAVTPAETRPRLQPKASHPPVHWWALAAVGALVAAGAAIVLRLREQLPPLEPDADEREELLAAVDLSLDDLETDPDPRRAVIRAYARMERALARHGVARRPSETPFEYLGRALASLRVGRASIERLTALFEWAKFSQHDVDLSMKAEALGALAALRDELGGAAA